MIKYFQDLPSRPKIISMMSIALRDDAGVRKTVLEAEVNPLQRQGALEMGSRFIDTKAIVDGHPEYFADGVHLKAIGYAAIAKAVEAEVRALAATADAGATSDGPDSRRHLTRRTMRGGLVADAGRRRLPRPVTPMRRQPLLPPTATADAAGTTRAGPDAGRRRARRRRPARAAASPAARDAQWAQAHPGTSAPVWTADPDCPHPYPLPPSAGEGEQPAGTRDAIRLTERIVRPRPRSGRG